MRVKFYFFETFKFISKQNFRYRPMDAWNTGKSRNQTNESLDPVKITERYQTLQYQNYLQYVKQMQEATGVINHDPLGLSYQKHVASIKAVQIVGLPPGRPAERKLQLTRGNMTYGDYKRSQQGDYSIEKKIAKNAPYQKSPRIYDPRDKNREVRSTADDGWGEKASTSRQSSQSVNLGDDDWEDSGPSAPDVTSKSKYNIKWEEFEDIKSQPSQAGKNSEVKKVSDDWDDDTTENQSASVKKSDESSSTPKAVSTAKKIVDWGDLGDPSPFETEKKCQPIKADWSDGEDSVPAKRFRSEKVESISGWGGHFKNNRDGSCSSRSTFDGNVSRESSASYRGRSREGSRDHYRSDNRSDRQYSHDRPPREPRQPRKGDWDCPKCKNNNFAFRIECMKCQEPKDDTGTGGYESRDSSHGYRGKNRGRGGYNEKGSRGGFRNNGGSFSNQKSNMESVKSGWSDEENDKPKKPTAVQDKDDNWDSAPVVANSTAKKLSNGSTSDDDFWDTVASKNKTQPVNLGSCEQVSAKNELDNSWGSPKVIEKESKKSETKSSTADDDWN